MDLLTKSRANLILQYLEKLRYEFGPLVIVETGTIRNTAPEYITGDGHSTHIIAKNIQVPPDTFYSIDLDIAVAERYLQSLNLSDKVNLIKSDSVQYLHSFNKPIHLAYLDSANDPVVVLNEFKAVESKIVKRGYVIIDDCVPGSLELLKGNQAIPYAKSKGYKINLTDRQGVIQL